MPCDCTFGVNEKEKQKKRQVYLPKDYKVINRKTSKMLVIIVVMKNMFHHISVKSLKSQTQSTPWMMITKVKQIKKRTLKTKMPNGQSLITIMGKICFYAEDD